MSRYERDHRSHSEHDHQGRQGNNDNPHRLYRNTEHRILTGVCAGLADYFGFDRRAVRIAMILAAIPFFAFVVVAYIVMSLVLPERPRQLYEDKEQEEFWRKATMEPKNTFGTVRHRFRELDMRLQKLEAYITSKRFEIDRALKD